jgi:HK97 family phage major capsid protein
MHIVTQLEEARQRHSEAVNKMEDWDVKVQDLPDEATAEEVEFFRNAFTAARAEAARWADQVERLEAISEARRQIQPPAENDEPAGDVRDVRVKVGNEPLTYREKGEHSFFHDLYDSQVRGNSVAANRLSKHMAEMAVEQRDLTTGDPGGGSFIPPLYLADRWIELPRPRRPFADAVPKIPLDPDGMTMSFPRIQTGATVAEQATENTAVSETDLDTETYQVSVRTIAGQNDVSRQLLERSRPGMDEVIFRDLLRAYDGRLDTQLISGSGVSGQHTGIRTVAGINTITFSSGDGAALIKKVYDAVQQIASNVYGTANLIVMHPRRSAWLAAHQGTTFPLLQQGGLMQAQGEQNNGFVGTIAGLPVLADPNIATNTGAATNQDEIFVVAVDELMLAEGPIRTDVFRDVLSGTLTVRLQISAYSAFAGGRLPKAISTITGAGLTPPTF